MNRKQHFLHGAVSLILAAAMIFPTLAAKAQTDEELIEEGITSDDFDNSYLIGPGNTLVEEPGGVGVADDGTAIYEEGSNAVIING